MKRANYWIVAGIFIVASLFIVKVNTSREGVSYSARLDKFPFKIGRWKGSNIKVENSVFEILGTRDVLMRSYRDGNGDKVTLAVVYSGSRHDSFHPPEYCYIGGGIKLADKTKEDIILGKGRRFTVNKLIMRYAGGTIKAWYWYAADNVFIDNYYLQQMHFIWDAFKGNKRGGALIRVSVDGGGHNLENKAKDFIREALPILKRVL